MLFSPREIIEDKVVRSLAAKPYQSYQELFAELSQSGMRISTQALYRALLLLRKEGVLVRAGRTYSLSLTWVLHMQELTNVMYKTHVSRFPALSCAPEAGGDTRWVFRDLVQLNAFWTHLILYLFERVATPTMYDWVPHPWFYFIEDPVEHRFLREVKRKQIPIYRIVGGNSKLDRMPLTVWKQMLGRTSYTPESFARYLDRHYVVIGDYLITLKLGKKRTELLQQLFSEQDVFSRKPGLLHSSIFFPQPLILTLEYKTATQRRIRKRFIEFFDGERVDTRSL